ncbi:MAG: cell division protein FtsA [Alphaproteobacteria bacterium]|nr:cell division protein FtsA [Alphaproteobacteria bacterium]
MKAFAQKKKTHRGDLVAALDIGTSKVCCAIAVGDLKEKSGLRLLGMGQQSARGIKSGTITDMDALEDSILNAVHTAEQNAERTIGSLYVSLPACFITSTIVDVEMNLGAEAVDTEHVRHLLTMGKHAKEFRNAQIIHALPIIYSLDGQEGIRDPKGMFGQNLKAQIHILSAPNAILKNIAACIGRCHLDVSGFVVSSYASGLATLVDDELELGVTVIDIGGGTTTIASFINGALVYLSSTPLGGQHITSDIARGLSTPLSQAERLKTLYGSVFPINLDDREHIIVPQLGDDPGSTTHQVPKSFFIRIIRARIDEIFELAWRQMEQSSIADLIGQRIVLTGGASQLPGLVEFLTQQWQCPVRMGNPIGFQSAGDLTQNPSFSTCAGLLHYAYRDEKSREVTLLPQHDGHFWQRFIGWFKENF